MPTEWEYRILTKVEGEEAEDWLNRMSRQGWRLCRSHVISAGTAEYGPVVVFLTLIVRRPVAERATRERRASDDADLAEVRADAERETVERRNAMLATLPETPEGELPF